MTKFGSICYCFDSIVSFVMISPELDGLIGTLIGTTSNSEADYRRSLKLLSEFRAFTRAPFNFCSFGTLSVEVAS